VVVVEAEDDPGPASAAQGREQIELGKESRAVRGTAGWISPRPHHRGVQVGHGGIARSVGKVHIERRRRRRLLVFGGPARERKGAKGEAMAGRPERRGEGACGGSSPG